MHWQRFIFTFLKSFALLFTVFFLMLYFVLNALGALVLAALFASLFSIFAAGHIERNMNREVFEINSSNKNPQIGLQTYYEIITEHLMIMRYQKIDSESESIIFKPRPRLRVMGGDVIVTRTPYEITIDAPVGVVRILKSQLDIKKIFL